MPSTKPSPVASSPSPRPSPSVITPRVTPSPAPSPQVSPSPMINPSHPALRPSPSIHVTPTSGGSGATQDAIDDARDKLKKIEEALKKQSQDPGNRKSKQNPAKDEK